MSLLTDDIIVKVETPNESSKQPLKLICEFSNVSEHKVNIKTKYMSHINCVKENEI